MEYTLGELVDMHLVLGECVGNGTAAATRYRERYPNRRVPDRRTFLAVDRRLRETGTLRRRLVDTGIQ